MPATTSVRPLLAALACLPLLAACGGGGSDSETTVTTAASLAAVTVTTASTAPLLPPDADIAKGGVLVLGELPPGWKDIGPAPATEPTECTVAEVDALPDTSKARSDRFAMDVAGTGDTGTDTVPAASAPETAPAASAPDTAPASTATTSTAAAISPTALPLSVLERVLVFPTGATADQAWAHELDDQHLQCVAERLGRSVDQALPEGTSVSDIRHGQLDWPSMGTRSSAVGYAMTLDNGQGATATLLFAAVLVQEGRAIAVLELSFIPDKFDPAALQTSLSKAVDRLAPALQAPDDHAA